MVATFFKPAPSNEQYQKQSCNILREQFDCVAEGRPINTRMLTMLEEKTSGRNDEFSLSIQANCHQARQIENEQALSPNSERAAPTA